jgi:homoserine kinase
VASRTIRVSVPATSANLGPGFDALGVALDWRSDLTFEERDTPSEIAEPVAGMAAGAARELLQQAGLDAVYLGATYEGDQPIGRGLGMSASARAAGLVAAAQLLEAPPSVEDLIPLAVQLEGHADNIVPALLGGLRICVEHDGEIVQTEVPLPDELKLALIIPDFSMPTNESRKRLPERLTRSQAVHNVSRVALLLAAIQRREWDLLAVATEDVIHQPARSTLFPAMYPIFEAAREAGAHGVYLSGGGSTIAAFVTDDGESIAAAMRDSARAHGLEAVSRVVALSGDGVQVLEGGA